MEEKLDIIRASFLRLTTSEAIYQMIMEWGKTRLPPFEPEWKVEENRVLGCQSMTYLHARREKGKLYFSAASDALISAGLAALLIYFYNGESPDHILTVAPSFLEELGIPASLTPGRANGLASFYLKMKRDAVSALTTQKMNSHSE